MIKQGMLRTGLVVAALLAVSDIATAGLGVPLWVTIASIVVGLVTLAALVPAWRQTHHTALRVVLASRIVSGLLAVPGLFIGDTVAQVTSAVAVVGLSVLAVVLIMASHAVSRVAAPA
jgi:hypothetical protein